jgi:formate dehydrogenase major subunit
VVTITCRAQLTWANPDSLPGYFGLATGAWKHWCNVWGVDYEWVKKQFASQAMMEKSGTTVSRWIDAVLEKMN